MYTSGEIYLFICQKIIFTNLCSLAGANLKQDRSRPGPLAWGGERLKTENKTFTNMRNLKPGCVIDDEALSFIQFTQHCLWAGPEFLKGVAHHKLQLKDRSLHSRESSPRFRLTEVHC